MDALTKQTVKKYSLWGLGAVVAILALRRVTAPKPADDKKLVEPVPAAPIHVGTWALSDEQERLFTAALPAKARPYAGAFLYAGRQQQVSPVVLAGIMWAETRFGDECRDAACRGATKRDWGLMQINQDAHPDFFKATVGGRPAYEDPVASINYAAKVLRGTIDFFKTRNKSGLYPVSKKSGLKYSCVPGDRKDPRPLPPELMIVAGIAGYNAGQGNAIQAMACGLSPDAATHGRDYAARVLTMARQILENMAKGG